MCAEEGVGRGSKREGEGVRGRSREEKGGRGKRKEERGTKERKVVGRVVGGRGKR